MSGLTDEELRAMVVLTLQTEPEASLDRVQIRLRSREGRVLESDEVQRLAQIYNSDYAAAASAIAFGVLAFSRFAGVLFLAAATAIGLSRIALGLHYPSDVLAGILVGWAAAMLVTVFGRRWIELVVGLVSRVSDPLLAPVWGRIGRERAPGRQ